MNAQEKECTTIKQNPWAAKTQGGKIIIHNQEKKATKKAKQYYYFVQAGSAPLMLV